jgi:hypothetical protein
MSSDNGFDDLPEELQEAFTALAYYMQAKSIITIVLSQAEYNKVTCAVKYGANKGETLQ